MFTKCLKLAVELLLVKLHGPASCLLLAADAGSFPLGLSTPNQPGIPFIICKTTLWNNNRIFKALRKFNLPHCTDYVTSTLQTV